MSTLSKRTIFWTLVLLFITYTTIIYTTGDEKDNAQQFMTEDAQNGKLLFQEHNCVSCHQLYGLGGHMGPDLTNVISAAGKGEVYAKAFIQSGTQRMPNFQLTEQEINALTAYLKYVDKTGISPVIHFKVEYNGTITQKTE